MVVVKKYSNRRLYDTETSRYITMEELAEKIRTGANVRVVDAKTDEDLTQATLTQLIIESRGAGKLLPVPLLTQLIRMGDDALAEFFGQYLTGALEMYLSARESVQAIAPYNPFAQLPFSAGNAFARMFSGQPMWGGQPQPQQPPPPPPRAQKAHNDDVADLRRELDELKDLLRAQAGSKKRK